MNTISNISSPISSAIKIVEFLPPLPSLPSLPSSSSSLNATMNMNDLYLVIVFSFIYVVGTIGVMTIILLYQEEIDNVQSLSVNQLSDFNLQKLLKMYAKFVFFIFFLSIFYRLVIFLKV